MLFVKNDSREKSARITHGSILKDDVILISFYENYGDGGCKQGSEIYSCNSSPKIFLLMPEHYHVD
jgi:hypothetical protein